MRLLLCAAALASVSSTCVGKSAQLEARQCSAWQLMFDAMGGSRWTKCSSNRDDPCDCGDVGTVLGVACSGAAITRIALADNQLRGTIPEESLGQFMQLTQLDLSYNQLMGTIPPSLASLSNLNGIYLRANLLRGTIPAIFSHLTALTALDLFNNGLNGTIPSNLGETALTMLRVNVNQLSGSLPASLSKLAALTEMDLNYNHLTGSIPPSFSRLGKLQYLGLACNSLTGIVPLLPFAQYEGCDIGGPDFKWCDKPATTNQFSCPLPPNATDSCHGVSCKN